MKTRYTKLLATLTIALAAASMAFAMPGSEPAVEAASAPAIALGGPCATLAMSSTHELCQNDATGTATVSAAGGVPPYTYLWSSGQTTASITGLVGGTYTVTVTDGTGCTTTDNATVNAGSDLVPDPQPYGLPDCEGVNNGFIPMGAFGGTPPYSFAWSNGATTATKAFGM